MPALRLITEKIFRPIQVYITKPNSRLCLEISEHLEDVDGVKIVDQKDKPDVIVHIVGLGESEYSETLSHTSELHTLLDKALQCRAKFILVKTKNYPDLGKTAVSMISQFSRLFKLTYTVLEIDTKDSDHDIASEVIRSFVHGFKPKEKVKKIVEKKVVNHRTYKLALGVFFVLGLLQLTFVFGAEKWQQDLMSLKSGNFWNYFLSINYIFAPIPKIVWEKRGGSLDALKTSQRQINQFVNEKQKYLASWDAYLKKPESQALNEVQENLQSLLEKAGFLQAISNNSELNMTRIKLSKINSIFSELPYLFGFKSTVKYLILNQNKKDEIVDVTIASVEGGKVTSTKNYTAGFLDGQLRGEVNPPEDFKLATGISKWGIKYVNWDPDFNQVAARAAWFISKQLNVGVDVVVGTHMNFEELEKISSETLLSKLESREITIVNIHEPKSQLSRVGWDGGLDYQICKQTKGCVSDFMFNKNTFNYASNAWLDIRIKEDTIDHAFKAVFADDKNYWRVLIPGKVFVGQAKTADLNYSTNYQMDKSLKYRLFIPNQPGVKEGNIKINIKFNPNWKVIASEKAVVAMPGELEYNSDLSRPFLVDLTFNK